jgi:hypothetical protein
LVGGLTMGWVRPINFYWGLKMPGEDWHKTSLHLLLRLVFEPVLRVNP